MERITTRTARGAIPTSPCHAERLGAGTRVGDHHRASTAMTVAATANSSPVLGELRGDGGEDDALRDAVERRVQERAERRALARHPRVAAVERVHDRADDERDAAEEEVVRPDEHGGDDVERQARSARSRSASGATRSGALRARSRALGEGWSCSRGRRGDGGSACRTASTAGRARASSRAARRGRAPARGGAEDRVHEEVVAGRDDHEGHEQRDRPTRTTARTRLRTSWASDQPIISAKRRASTARRRTG